jgi:hypothetical protein
MSDFSGMRYAQFTHIPGNLKTQIHDLAIASILTAKLPR